MNRLKFFLLLLVTLLSSQLYAADYGSEDGFFVFLDAAFVEAGNTDQVVAEAQNLGGMVQTVDRLAIDWEANAAGALGFGYRWDQNTISVRYWQFDNDESMLADGTSGATVNFAIGPASYYYFPSYGYYQPVYYFGLPGSFDFQSNIQASTVDVTFAQTFEAGEYFDLEWSVGVRYASFEESITGLYDLCASTGCDAPYSMSVLPGEITFDVLKITQSDMMGATIGLNGRYYFADWAALAGGFSYSLLTGDVESQSGLTPSGTFNGTDRPTLARRSEEGHGGSISDVWVGIDWLFIDDRLRFHTGLYYSNWDGIAEDLVRNTPGIEVFNPARDSVSFSGARASVQFQF